MDKKEVIGTLEIMLEEIKYKHNNPKHLIYGTEAQEALEFAIKYLKHSEDNTKKESVIKKDTYSKEELKVAIQDNCSHIWGFKHWENSCFYTCKCLKCGKVEKFYERD